MPVGGWVAWVSGWVFKTIVFYGGSLLYPVLNIYYYIAPVGP